MRTRHLTPAQAEAMGADFGRLFFDKHAASLSKKKKEVPHHCGVVLRVHGCWIGGFRFFLTL
jgi:hypothetical protein